MTSMLPCPHCGMEIQTHIGHGNIRFFTCDNPNCGAISSFRGTSSEAEEFVRWNRRVNEQDHYEE